MISNKSRVPIGIFAICLTSVLLEHFFAPIGLYTCITSIAISAYLAYDFKVANSIYKLLIIYIAIAINDIGMKLYGGGMHDREGQGFLNLQLVAQDIIAFVFVILIVIQNRKARLIHNLLYLLVFISLLTIHALIFADLGIGRNYETTIFNWF